MHGLINRSIQKFVCDTYSTGIWQQVAGHANLGFVDFEAMLVYEKPITSRVLDSLSAIVGRPGKELLEDLGAYLVSNPNQEGVRRLLRFGGVNFEEFLHSLDDLPERAKLAVPDLVLPSMELDQSDEWRFSLLCRSPVRGVGYLMMGVLRVMADDYGALALFDSKCLSRGYEVISIIVIDRDYAEGRHFDLGATA